MAATDDTKRRWIAIWLYAVAAVIFVTLLVGGATRLTESGLSITEWRPVTGALPPLSDAEWQSAFEQYKTIPQYQSLNAGMSLADFKTIYWWEWGHRLMGRLSGFVFLLPFLVFLWRGWIGPDLRSRLWLIFGLGALQGAVGWWMVRSGLADRLSVSPYRLAFHLTLACLVYASVIWVARRLRSPPTEAPGRPAPMRLCGTALALLALVIVQIYLGALVAGLDAGQVYNTWPLIDGGFIPAADRLFFLHPLWRNLFENDLAAQFVHRMTAYTLWTVAVLHAVDALRSSREPKTVRLAMIFAAGVTLQAALGITTLLMQAPLDLSLAHQALAVILLAFAVVHAARLVPRRTAAAPAAVAVSLR